MPVDSPARPSPAASRAPLIEVDRLVRDYPGHRALDTVSLRIAPGTVTALVGPNGAGKTTLMRCLAALDAPFAGRIRIAGIDATEKPRMVHRMTGFLQDFFGLYNALTVEQGLWYAAAARAVPPADIPERIAWAADAVGLRDRLGDRAGTLSRGMRQRLAVAQTMVHRPRVLLLDEPASGLDPENRAGLSRLLRDLRTRFGMTLIVSSHILSELEDYSTHVMILNHGRLVRHDALDTAAGPSPGWSGTADDSHGASPAHPLRLAVSLSQPTPDAPARLRALPGVHATLVEGDASRLILDLDRGATPADRAALLRTLLARDLPVCGFAPLRRDLQDVYLDHVRAGGDDRFGPPSSLHPLTGAWP